VNHYRHLRSFSLGYLIEYWGITPPFWLDGDFGASTTNQMIFRWLDDQADSSQPFFLFANYMEAHAPYRIPRRFREMFMTPEQVHRSYDLRHAVTGEIQAFNIEGSDVLGPEECEALSQQYNAGIRYLDERIGDLIGALERRQLLENTLVIITADHGEYLDEHGMWAHTFLAYDGVTRVPLIVREPGRELGIRVTTPARLADIHHTVMRMVDGAGYQPPGHDTHDLIDLAAQPSLERTVVTSWSGAEDKLARRIERSDDPEVRHRGRAQTAIQDGRYKLMVSADGRRELYDLLTDPGELDNLIEREPEIRARLEGRLAEWEAAVPRYVSEKRTGVEPMSAQMLRDLAALGYAGSEAEGEVDDDSAPE
jgi:arylsulfatase A-like enzyme